MEVGTVKKRVVMITGGSRGLGFALARAFGAQGDCIVVIGRTPAGVDSAVADLLTQGYEALPVVADVSNDVDIDRAVKEIIGWRGRIDVLVNNAAVIHRRESLTEMDLATWRAVFAVNITGLAMTMRAVIPVMRGHGGGSIINVASAGARQGAAGRGAYRATKAAVVSLTESVAAEVVSAGITVTCLCPGSMDTEGYRAAFGSSPDPSTAVALEAVADVALFLASPAAAALTGAAFDARALRRS